METFDVLLVFQVPSHPVEVKVFRPWAIGLVFRFIPRLIHVKFVVFSSFLCLVTLLVSHSSPFSTCVLWRSSSCRLSPLTCLRRLSLRIAPEGPIYMINDETGPLLSYMTG